MVLCLAKSVSLELESRDIKDIFRLQGKRSENQNEPIILDLGSTLLKSDLLKKVKTFNKRNKDKLCAIHLGHNTNVDIPVYVSEQLTAKGARLYFLARDLVRNKKYKYCWTSFGKVYIRQDETTRSVLITNESQVHKLMQSA
jgi:hypothetical protein